MLADLARAIAARTDAPAISLAVICRDGQRMAALSRALAFFGPDIVTLEFPAWDCLPYDRVSPNASVVAQRMTALSRLARVKGRDKPSVLLTTVNAALQRVPAREFVATHALSVAPGNVIGMAGIIEWLELNGFTRASTVREPGDYAVRGGILDLYPPGMDMPVRFDFFGDALETIRSFDAQTQRSETQLRGLDLVPVAEFQLITETHPPFPHRLCRRIRRGAPDDLLYEAVSEGRRYPGMEHWLPLFHDRLETLFDYLPGTPLALEHLAEDAAHERFTQIADYYDTRREALKQGVTPALQAAAAGAALSGRKGMEGAARRMRRWRALTPFAVPDAPRCDRCRRARRPQFRGRARRAGRQCVRGGEQACAGAAGVRQARRHRAVERRRARAHEPRARRSQIAQSYQCRVMAAGPEPAQARDRARRARHRIRLRDRGRGHHQRAGYSRRSSGAAAPRQRRADNFIAEATSLAPGDLVVHVDHGIGRFVGLQAIEAAGAPHDCLEIHYAEDAKLFLPVENVDLLSRYGAEQSNVELDRLGGGNWQARKARMKSRIREIAGELIKIAAERLLREAPRFNVGPGAYDEFCAGFPYEETDDQLAAIDATIKDLGSGRPMDRLICGDVGFGKTEVALRAAFVAAINGKQVAVVVPTTLLARQHFKTFSERFRGFPVNVAQASRLVPTAQLNAVKAGLADGSVDIVIGTHALLGKGITFKDLALLVVDEEQHFGVAHKEKLKTLRSEVHVLTLTATPIPRTLQLALTGVRDLSIIASPPVDRLAVRTFVSPFDPITVREALLREKYRGGQAFYVCPRIEDLAGAKDFLDKNVPEVRVTVAHGQMPPTVLDDIMSAFYDGKYDVLLSTTIIESGLDIPTANTLDRAPRRPVRPVAALSAARPGRARQAARLCAVHVAGAEQDHGAGRAAAEGAAIARHARRRLPARVARSRHSRRRQSAGRRAIRPHQGSRLRTVPADAGRGGAQPEGRHQRAGRRPLVAADHHRHGVAHSGGLCRRSVGAAGALPPAGRDRRRTRDRELRRRTGRPLRPAAGRGRASVAGGGDQGAVPPRQCRKAGGRAEGRRAVIPRQYFRQSGWADRLYPRAGLDRAHARRSEGRQGPAIGVLRRLGAAGRAA